MSTTTPFSPPSRASSYEPGEETNGDQDAFASSNLTGWVDRTGKVKAHHSHGCKVLGTYMESLRVVPRKVMASVAPQREDQHLQACEEGIQD